MSAPKLHDRESHRTTIHRLKRLALVATPALVSALLVAPGAAATTHHGCRAGHDPATVVTDWNALTQTTIAGDTTKDPREAFLYTAFVQAAEYNAVVGTSGRYQPYR